MRAIRVKKRYRRRLRKEVLELRRENAIRAAYGEACFKSMCKYKDMFYTLLTEYNNLKRGALVPPPPATGEGGAGR